MDSLKALKTRLDKVITSTEDALGKLSNSANLIRIFGRSLELATNKLLQKENQGTVWPIARTRQGPFWGFTGISSRYKA